MEPRNINMMNLRKGEIIEVQVSGKNYYGMYKTSNSIDINFGFPGGSNYKMKITNVDHIVKYVAATVQK